MIYFIKLDRDNRREKERNLKNYNKISNIKSCFIKKLQKIIKRLIIKLAALKPITLMSNMIITINRIIDIDLKYCHL